MTTTAEETEEQRIRKLAMACISCNRGIQIGPNYPVGMTIPAMLELYCPRCGIINLFYRPVLEPATH